MALLENLTKQIMVVPDKLFMELLTFLDNADKNGKSITTQVRET